MSQKLNRPKPTLRRRAQRMLLVLLMLYLMACMGCAAFQRRLLYFPTHASPAALDQFARSQGLERWKNSAGQNIGWKRRSRLQPAQGQVLITQGNGGCAVDRVDFANQMQKTLALDVYLLEYPGFGDRAGSPSEGELFKAAEEFLQTLPKNKPVYLVGESLGTGVAAYLAGNHPAEIAGVLLVAPYNNLTAVAQHHVVILPARWLLREHFPSDENLRCYHGPVAIVVGGKDRVVPAKFGRRLYDGHAGPKRLWEMPQADHVTIHEQSTEFWNEVFAFWQTNQTAR